MPSGTRRESTTIEGRSRAKKTPRLTCVNCRTKKIRCDGGQPTCGICTAYDEECSYDKPPPMSQVLAMTEKIKHLEQALEDLQHSRSDRLRSNELPDPTASNEVPAPEPVAGPSSDIIIPETSAIPTAPVSTHVEGDLDTSDAYYDTTSAVHAPRGAETDGSPAFSPYRERATAHIPQLRVDDIATWQELAIANCAVILQLPSDKIRHLLAIHWTWVHPAFMFVDPETFLRDAAAGGEYFSPLLLTAICLHSTRFTDHDLTERLLAHVKILLGQVIHKEPSITSVQALLQLSAREIGNGATSQAWLYSGMAFRIALDLGLFSGQRGPDENCLNVEQARRFRIGRRLAWSCFLWDKTISLYLGRAPTLPIPPDSPLDAPTTSSNDALWSPYSLSGTSVIHTAVPARTAICFHNFCKLGSIINDILLRIYGREKTTQVGVFIKSKRTQLEHWYEKLPEDMRLDRYSFSCPTPHVLTQNLLYRAAIILLLRPFQRSSACRTACREAASDIEHLFLTLERTFGLSRATYLTAYCAYIAATVAVQDTRDNVAGAQQRVSTYMRVLAAVRYSCPGIQRSMDIINQCLQSAPRPATTNSTSTSAPVNQQRHQSNISSFDPLPMFPNNDCSYPYQVLDSSNVTAQQPTSIGFEHLDSYTVQWSDFSDDIFDTVAF